MTDYALRDTQSWRTRTLRLSSLIIVILLIWITVERRQSSRELRLARTLAQQERLDFQLGGPYESSELRAQNRSQGWWRNLARRVFGPRVLVVTVTTPDFGEVSQLDGLWSLRRMNLTRTRVRDFTPFARFPNLEFLDVRANAGDDLTPLARLRNMQHLWIKGSPVRDLTPLANLLQLESLDISGTQVDSLQALTRLSKLRRLYINATAIRDLAPLHKLPELRVFWLQDTLVSERDVDALKQAIPQCTSLEYDRREVNWKFTAPGRP